MHHFENHYPHTVPATLVRHGQPHTRVGLWLFEDCLEGVGPEEQVQGSCCFSFIARLSASCRGEEVTERKSNLVKHLPKIITPTSSA